MTAPRAERVKAGRAALLRWISATDAGRTFAREMHRHPARSMTERCRLTRDALAARALEAAAERAREAAETAAAERQERIRRGRYHLRLWSVSDAPTATRFRPSVGTGSNWADLRPADARARRDAALGLPFGGLRWPERVRRTDRAHRIRLGYQTLSEWSLHGSYESHVRAVRKLIARGNYYLASGLCHRAYTAVLQEQS